MKEFRYGIIAQMVEPSDFSLMGKGTESTLGCRGVDANPSGAGRAFVQGTFYDRFTLPH